MTGKRFHVVWLLGLALIINSCGNDAPPDAVVTAVTTDKTIIISGSTGVPPIVEPVQFKVEAASDNTTPVANATVDLFGSSPGLGDPTAGFVTGSTGGTFVNGADPNHIQMRTDSTGVVTTYYQFSIPPCQSGATAADITATAQVTASIGGSSAVWKDDITIKKC